MDYFVEIALSDGIQEALERVPDEHGFRGRLYPEAGPSRQWAGTHPSLWRAALVNWFYRHPDFAARVWRALGRCHAERELTRALGLSPWPPAPPPAAQQFIRELGLPPDATESQFRAALRDANQALIDQSGTVPAPVYPGPALIERLIREEDTEGRRWYRRRATRSKAQHDDAIVALIEHPVEVKRRADSHGWPVPFAIVHERELDQIDAARRDRGLRAADDEGAPLHRALTRNLLGLAFSGGGIRSATFNLGVLQALAKLDVLRHCDYLSTVSGGGYIGTWFSAWTQRESHDGQTGQALPGGAVLDRMRQFLSPVRTPNPLDTGIRPIRYLREFSNYLTPRTGFLSADTWTMVAIYARNLLLNLLVLVPLIAAVLLLPRLVYGLSVWLFGLPSAPAMVALVIFVCVGIAVAFLIANLRRASEPRSPHDVGAESVERPDEEEITPPWFAHQAVIQLGVVVPLLVAAWLTTTGYWLLLSPSTTSWTSGWKLELTPSVAATLAGLCVLAYLAIVHWGGHFCRFWPAGCERGSKTHGQAVRALVLATVGGALAGGALFWVLGLILPHFGPRLAIAFGTPLTLATFSLIIVIQLGLLGSTFPDEQREWWSRLRAWTLIYSLGWAALFAVAICIPELEHRLREAGSSMSWSALAAWLLSTVAGIKTGGNAAATRGASSAGSAPAVKPPKSAGLGPTALRIVALAAPYVFIVGLLALVAIGLEPLARPWCPATGDDGWRQLARCDSGWLLLLAVGLVLGASAVSSRIGVNEFSMHNFYKNRLVRCYLGASRWRSRVPDWFTGFDAKDDVYLSRFDHVAPSEAAPWSRYPGPYPIVSAALNLVAGEDLAWQERKATSFVFTPKYCGYDLDRAVLTKDKRAYWPDAFAPTRHYVAAGAGPTFGTAMAISGAAANPNMGMATSSASAFLMTVFNARLGWWLPNPRRKDRFLGWARSGPGLGVTYTAVELFGLTNDKRKFVNVSDGGHFENLGVYELIRRGCKLIIASDAGQDGGFSLEDLGNLIRKVRVDFGVEIEIATDQIRDRNAKGWSTTHCVVGKIDYLTLPDLDDDGAIRVGELGQPRHATGLLVYLKPCITGDEPFDVLEYYRRVPEFPHESTADQWFNESQFESYRRLGLHVAEQAFLRFREHPDEPIDDVPALFRQVEEFWRPPSPKVAERGSEHTEEYVRIMELLRSDPKLSFLDPVLFSGAVMPWLTGPHRDEFYLCNALIQLIENVYVDLDLEQNYAHPHVEGWMKVFQSWARQDAFRRTWDISGNSYAPRFRNFYLDRLVNGHREG